MRVFKQPEITGFRGFQLALPVARETADRLYAALRGGCTCTSMARNLNQHARRMEVTPEKQM